MRIVIEIDTGAETPTVQVGGTSAAPTVAGMGGEPYAPSPAETSASSGGAPVLPEGAGPQRVAGSSALLTRAQMVGARDGGAAPVAPPADGAPPPFMSGPPAAPILGADQSDAPLPGDTGDISAGAAPGAEENGTGVVTIVEESPVEALEAEDTVTAKPSRGRKS